jgi:hypothetical protein
MTCRQFFREPYVVRCRCTPKRGLSRSGYSTSTRTSIPGSYLPTSRLKRCSRSYPYSMHLSACTACQSMVQAMLHSIAWLTDKVRSSCLSTPPRTPSLVRSATCPSSLRGSGRRPITAGCTALSRAGSGRTSVSQSSRQRPTTR